MHARVYFYHVKPGTLDDTLARVRAEFVPMMRAQPGLRRYTAVRTGPDSFISLLGWDTREQADQTEAALLSWVWEHIGPTVVSRERSSGEVTLLHGQTAPDKTPNYGTVRVSTPKPDAPDLTEKMRTEFMPIFEQQPGFNVFTTIVTDDGKRISYAGWDSKEALEQARSNLTRYGEVNIRPHMSEVEVHQGEVAWTVRTG